MTWVTAEAGACALAVGPVLPDEQLTRSCSTLLTDVEKAAVALVHSWVWPDGSGTRRT